MPSPAFVRSPKYHLFPSRPLKLVHARAIPQTLLESQPPMPPEPPMPPRAPSPALDAQDYWELQQLETRLDELLAYAPACAAEELGLSGQLGSERASERMSERVSERVSERAAADTEAVEVKMEDGDCIALSAAPMEQVNPQMHSRAHVQVSSHGQTQTQAQAQEQAQAEARAQAQAQAQAQAHQAQAQAQAQARAQARAQAQAQLQSQSQAPKRAPASAPAPAPTPAAGFLTEEAMTVFSKGYIKRHSSIGSASSFSEDVSEASERTAGTTPKQRKTAWTNVEDCIIEEGVSTFGHKWSKIAEMLPNERTDDAVRNRWQRLRRRQQRRGVMGVIGLARASSEDSERGVSGGSGSLGGGSGSPGPAMLVQCRTTAAASAPVEAVVEDLGKHGDMWTPDEDQIIDYGVRVQGLRWRAIAELLPGRTESGCRNRWVRSQERQLAAEGVPAHGAAEVFAALRNSGRFPALDAHHAAS